jgi:gliding motility-associated-like protein
MTLNAVVSRLTIDAIANQTFTGSAMTPTIVVKDDATTLTEGTHYSVAYSNNTNEGTATVTITGLGNPTGTKTVTFGITMWTARTSAADNSWISVTYGNGLFVAIAGSGTGNRVMTSPDGITWTARTSAADLGWFSVTYGNGLFVAVATTGTGNRVMTSPDGINWTARTSAADNDWFGVTYGNGLFVAVAYSGTGNRVMTSPDGITWTARTSAADNYWYDVTYGNGLFVAVAATGAGNRVMTSPDGINWTARTSAADNIWSSVTYGNGLFVAVAATGAGNRVMTSPDGITWTARTSAADNFWWGLTYGNGLFVAVSFSGTGNRVMSSPDGITWTAQTPAADNNWYGVTYGNGLFVAVANSGTGNRVMTLNAVVSRLTIDAIANQTFTGSALTPTIVVKDDATTLTLGTHYSVAYSNNTNVGTATVTISGRGNYTGTKTQTFSIARPTMSIVSGNNQSGAVNQALADSPILKVINPDGTPAANVSLTVTTSAGQVNSPVLSNTSVNYTDGGFVLKGTEWKAFIFTTSNTIIVSDKVSIVLNSMSGSYSTPPSIQVEAALYTVVNGVPSLEIGTSGLQSFVLPANATWATLNFSTPIELSPATSYALVLKSNSNGVKWANVTPGQAPQSDLINFSNAMETLDAGANWSNRGINNAFILSETASLSSTKTISTNANGTTALGSWVLGDRAGTQELVVTNASLSGSPLTITATATAVVPSAPTTLSYTSGNGQVSLSFTPGYDGGSAITNYEYSLDNGSAWAPLSPVDVSSPITISGLSDGVTYPLRIRAVNTAGSGVASAAINVIALIPLSYQSITIDAIASQTYTGSAITPTVVVKDGATTLTETTAYTVAYTSNTNVGTATVTITGTGNYSGTKAQTFSIVAKAASTLTIDAIANQTYTGSAITPTVVVKDGSTTLALGTDYTVAYTSNTNVGTATVTITGTGNYTGTKTQTFSIVAKAASTLTIEAIANQTYTGSAITPTVVVKDGSTTLTLGTDYTVAYSSNTNVGTATVTIMGTGNYSGDNSQTFAILPKAVILQANNASKIFGDANPSLSFSYSGLVAGDTEIDQVPVISTTASTTSGVGNYPITLTGGSDPNYSLTLVEGVLQVSPAPLSLTVNAVTKIYGQADPVYTYSLLGLKGSDTEAVLGGAFSREAAEDPGTYRISQGSLSAGANYTLTVTGASLQILKAKVSSVAQLALVTTAWSKEPALPATVKVLAAHGQDFQVEVKWDKSTLNLLARGTYSLTGTLLLPAGIENPNQVLAKIQVQVLPKPAPRDVTITNNTFVGSTTQFFISVGDFKINDPVDNIHVVSLLGKGYDNTYFQIKDNILFWNSAERAAGKTTFSIVVRVTDRDGNTLDKFFEIKRTRPDFSTVTIFNTFTPNADRFNDTWGVPEVRFYEGVRISVYERGGGRMFYTENPDVRWDGTYDGKEMPVGTYYWVIQIDETGATRRGIVNLLRK